MARTYASASSQGHTIAKSYLANNAGPFTISLYFAPANLTDTVRGVLAAGTGVGAYWQLRMDSGVVVFESAGYTGTNPGTSSSVTYSAASGLWIAWRYLGAGLEWSKWKSGVKTVINSSITFALPNVGAEFDIAHNWSGAYTNGTYAEMAIWQTALSDDQLQDIAAGVAADQVCPAGLLAYWPLRGNSNPEMNYVVPLDVLTPVNSSTTATHPIIVPPRYADKAEPAFVVDINGGAVTGATTDLYTEKDTDILGGAYVKRIGGDITLLDELPDGGAGVMIPSNTVITFRNDDDTFSVLTEYRQVPIKIRYYDRVSHALTTEFTGVVADVNISNNEAVFTCSSMDESVLDTLIPRQVIEPAAISSGILDDIDGTTVRHDVGAPIPKAFGVGGHMMPPYIGQSGTVVTAQNLIVNHGTACTLERAWGNTDPNSPGLELLTLWGTCVGTPTYRSTNSFTVNSFGLGVLYDIGMPVRRIYAGGTVFSDIASTNFGTAGGGTVTLTDPILGTPIGTVYLAGDYTVDRNRYKYVGTGGTTFLTTMRMPASVDSAIVCRVNEPTYGNPLTAIYWLLTDPDLGLNASADATSFFTTAVAVSVTGMGSAVSGVLGGDQQQRRAIDVINELAQMRGIRIWKDADDDSWHATADAIPAASTVTLSYGPDSGTNPSPNNVRRIVSVTTTPLSDAVSVLKLRYGKGWVDRGTKPLLTTDYNYTATMTVLGVGAEKVITTPWINDHSAAARMLYYIGKRLQREDFKVVIEMGNEARRLALGQLVTVDFQISPTVRITTDMRITARQRTLTSFTLTLVGYNDDIFETNLATIVASVNQPAGDINPDERGTQPGNDANLIRNADWTAGLTKSTWNNTDEDVLPDWTLFLGAHVTGLRTATEQLCKGGAYLEFITATDAPDHPPYISTEDSSNTLNAISVRSGANYILSVYVSRPDAWRFAIRWEPSEVTQYPQIKVNPGDVNGLGYQRYYAVITAPPNTSRIIVALQMTGSTSAETFRFDAVQLEELTRITLRPSPWKRNAAYGIHPDRITPGDFTVRASGKLELGTKIAVSGTVPVALSGSSTVTIGTAPVGMITAITGRKTATVAGVTNWKLALNHGGGTITPIGTAISTSTGTFTTDTMAGAVLSFPISMGSATPIVAIGTAAFTGGSVYAAAHSIQHVVPEA